MALRAGLPAHTRPSSASAPPARAAARRRGADAGSGSERSGRLADCGLLLPAELPALLRVPAPSEGRE